MVHKQTLYIAILIAATFGFMVGAVYTSFKLAKDSRGSTTVQNPHAQAQAEDDKAAAEAEAGVRILQLEDFLKENPDNAEAWVRLGNIFFDTDRFNDAIDAYERSLELAPGNPYVLTDLGVMHRRNKSPEKAIESFDRAIAAQPDFETARFNKGVVLMHDFNDIPSAIKVWEELVEINPVAEAPNGQLVNLLVEELKQREKE